MTATRPARPFARLLTAYAVSRSGDHLYNVSLLVHVYLLTGSATCVALTSAARLVPSVLLAPWAGVVVDRYQRVRVLLGSWLLSALVMAGLTAAVAAHLPVAVTVAGAALAVAVTSAAGPSVTALVAETVPPDGRTRANSALGVVEHVAVVAGPATAAVALLLGPAWAPFALNAASSLLAVVVLRGLRTVAPARAPRADVPVAAARRAREGLVAALEPPVRRVLLWTALSSVLFGAQVVLVAPVSSRLLGTGGWGAGVLEASAGVGGVAAALAAARWVRWTQHRHALPLAVAADALALLALSVLSAPAPAWLCLAVAGAGTLVVDVAALTRLQALVPGELLGRVDGLTGSLAVTAMLAGNLLAGVLVAAVDLRAAVVLTVLPVAVAGLLVVAPSPARRLPALAVPA